MKKVHIGGVYYGAHNVGDEAILTSMISSFNEGVELSVSSYCDSWIKRSFPEVNVRIINTNYSKPKLGIYATPRKNIVKVLTSTLKDKRFFHNKDLYICGGATILSDCPWYSLRTIEIAKQAGVKSILFGVGMAEISDPESLKYIKKVCNSLEDIYIRDANVKQRLIDIGVKDEKIKICYDPAIVLNKNNNFNIKDYLNDPQIKMYKDNNINIAVTLSGESDVICRTPIEDIKRILEYWLGEYDCNIFLIPTGLTKGHDDIRLLEKLLISKKVTLVNKEFLPEDLISFMENFSFVFSSRLHMNILGSIVGTPYIGLRRNSKVSDYSGLFGLKSFSIDRIDREEIIEYSKEIINNNKEYRHNILEKIKGYRSVHQERVREIRMKYQF